MGPFLGTFDFDRRPLIPMTKMSSPSNEPQKSYPNDELRKKQKYIALGIGVVAGLAVYAIAHYSFGMEEYIATIWWLITTIIVTLAALIVLMKTNPGDTSFTDEVNRIQDEYENDPKARHKALLAMENEPKSKTEADVYHIVLATALNDMNLKKDARKELEKVDMSNKETAHYVRKAMKE